MASLCSAAVPRAVVPPAAAASWGAFSGASSHLRLRGASSAALACFARSCACFFFSRRARFLDVLRSSSAASCSWRSRNSACCFSCGQHGTYALGLFGQDAQTLVLALPGLCIHVEFAAACACRAAVHVRHHVGRGPHRLFLRGLGQLHGLVRVLHEPLECRGLHAQRRVLGALRAPGRRVGGHGVGKARPPHTHCLRPSISW